MSHHPGFINPQPQLAINPTLHQTLLQAIDGLTQQVPPQVKQILSGQLAQNMGLISNLHEYVHAAALQRGVNLTMGQGLHATDLAQILHPWITNALAMIRQQMGPQMGMGVQPTYGGGVGYVGMQPQQQSPGSIYSSTADTSFQKPASVPMPAPPIVVQPHKEDTLSMPVETLMFNRLVHAEGERLDKNRGVELVDVPLESEWNNVRVSLYNLKSRRIANDAFEAYRDVYHLLPVDMKRGYWTQRVMYTELATIDLDTQIFRELRDKIRERYGAEKWRWAVDVLQSASQGVWSKIDTYLTERLNQLLVSRLRTEEHFSTSVTIQTVSDLEELLDPHFTSPLVEHPDFTKSLEALIHSVMAETFIHDTLVIEEVAPLMKARAVDYFDGNISKYDYGMLEPEKKAAMIKSMLSQTTVLQLRRCLVATNSIPPQAVHHLRDDSFVLPPDQQGVFGQSLGHMLSDNKPLPDVVVVSQFRVPPKESLNLLRPIYPMYQKQTYLVGNSHQIGW